MISPSNQSPAEESGRGWKRRKNMLPENSLAWGRSKSCIRELAAYGAARKQEIGPERVFDFSIGNPSVPAPQQT